VQSYECGFKLDAGSVSRESQVFEEEGVEGVTRPNDPGLEPPE